MLFSAKIKHIHIIKHQLCPLVSITGISKFQMRINTFNCFKIQMNNLFRKKGIQNKTKDSVHSMLTGSVKCFLIPVVISR